MTAAADARPDSRVSLLFGVHAHQPTGNFPAVIDHAHERCYRPFLQTLHRYPDFRFAAHFSGPLLDYLAARFPEDMRLLSEMSARGQVELFGAGDAEPVLAVIPNRDRIGQIERLSAKLERRFGQRPRGAWLTERVWESTVVPALADCGIRYVTVDDYHFLCTGRRQEELQGFFSTEEDGRRIDLFPISEALRYRFPFALAPDAVAYLEGLQVAGRSDAAVYFDDIEKFGVWPETFEWVYEKRWLELFIEGVLGSARIAPRTFGEFHAAHRTQGTIYLPTVSYVEMNEWTLPPQGAAVYGELLAKTKSAGRYDIEKPFVRGGIWKNFLSRYPEANWMHKRMLGLSARLAAFATGAQDAQQVQAMHDLLYAAQANDAYWHGLFGGLYLPHLRRGICRNLVALEAALDRQAQRPASTRDDVDMDGIDELFLHNGTIQAVIRLDGSAAVIEFDDYRLQQNFGDTLRRHPEHYHAKLDRQAHPAQSGEGIASAHDRVNFKHAIVPEDAAPDDQPQSMLRDAFSSLAGALAGIARRMDRYAETPAAGLAAGAPGLAASVPGLAVSVPELAVIFTCALDAGSVSKRIAIDGETLAATWHLRQMAPGEFRTTLALAMPSCDGVAGRYVVNGGIPGGFGQSFDWPSIAALALEDLFMGGAVALTFTPPARVRAMPYHSVSQSEDGFERIMQAVNLEISWPVSGADETLGVSMRTKLL